MEQGCPHRSILPHIFPDCNSLAIKIGGKFCGVRGVPRWGGLPRRCRRGGRQRYPAGGLPALPPANPAFGLISCPLPWRGRIDPRPPSPVGKGEIFCFLMQGAAPLASPGLNPGRHRSRGRTTHPAGVCLRNRQLAAKPIEQPFYWRCRQPRRGGTGGDGTIRRKRRRRLRWSSPPGQGEPPTPGYAFPFQT